MRKYYDKFFDETYYIETLDNGLTVIIFYKPDSISTTCAFGTPYGGLNINQAKNGKEYHFNPGIAHFLEHKLFESEDIDVFPKFSAMGCNVNAFTSYKETVYYFSTTRQDIKEPLNLLLDFVQKINITEKSVEKEKGIIAEELAMYLQNPVSRLLNETYKAMYHNFPLKYDIGGSKETVYRITKNELDTCYKINYHPSNMVLVITSGQDPNELIKIVKDNQKTKSFVKEARPISNNKEEPFEVKYKKHNFKMDVSLPKQVIAYKLSPYFKDSKEAFLESCKMSILLEALFTPMNPNYQEWLDQGLINDFFGFECDFDLDYAYVLFYIEQNDEKVLQKLIDETLNNGVITQELLTEIKRKNIGSSFDNLNTVEGFSLDYIRNYLEGLSFFEENKIINAIKLKDVDKMRDFTTNASKTIINLRKA